MKKLRFVLTYKCSKNCSFCYQKNRKMELPLRTFYDILNMLQKMHVDNVNVMGGEVLEMSNYMDYLVPIADTFNCTKKLVTAKYLPSYKHIQDIGFQVATSNFDKGDIINVFYSGKKEEMDSIEKFIATGKPLVICSDMNDIIYPPKIFGIKPVKIKGWVWEYPGINTIYVMHFNNYEYDELIVTPNGYITNSFEDVKNGF